MSYVHLLVYDGEGLYKVRCNNLGLKDEKHLDVKWVTCPDCIQKMTTKEDLAYRQSKVSYSELENIVRRVADAYNRVDNIFEIGKLADEIIRKLPGHSRSYVEESK